MGMSSAIEGLRELLNDNRPDCTSPLSLGQRAGSWASRRASEAKKSSNFRMVILNYKFKGAVIKTSHHPTPTIMSPSSSKSHLLHPHILVDNP